MGRYSDDYAHNLPREEAAQRLRALTDYWDAEYGTSTDWSGARGTIRGTISGRVLGLSFGASFTVSDETIHGDLKVSALALHMGGRAYLRRKLDHYMNPKVPLSELRSLIPDAA